MAAVSGSISLDMSKIEREITAAVGEEVSKIVMPALAQLSAQMTDLTNLVTATHLNPGNAAATLASALPAGNGPGAADVGRFQSERLAEMGYALVPVTPVTRLAVIATQPLPVPDGVDIGAEAARIAEQTLGPRGVDVEACAANGRADARRAETEDDWFERTD